VLNNLGINAYYRGNWIESLDFWSRSGEAREACGDIVGAATQTNNLGEIYSDQGRWDEARASFTEAIRIWEGARYSVGIALASSNLGRVEARSKNHRAAEAWLARAVDGFESIGAAALALEARIRVVENLLLEADERAEAQIRGLMPVAAEIAGAEIPEAILHRLLGQALHQKGDAAAAERALQRSLELADAADAPFERAQTLEAIALVRGVGPDLEAAAIFEHLAVVGTPSHPWSGLTVTT
jgi:tetratricopeptide (TPR) repeat protein